MSLPTRLSRTFRLVAFGSLRGQLASYFFDGGLGSEAVLFPQDVHCAMLDELIRPADADDGGFDTGVIEMFDDGAAEAVVQDMVLDGADDFDAACKEFDGAGIERLDPAGIDHSGADALCLEQVGGLRGH